MFAIAILDFLIPLIMAANYHNKGKEERELRESERERINNYEKALKIASEISSKYCNDEIEANAKIEAFVTRPITDFEKRFCSQYDNAIFLEDIVKTLPSYDENRLQVFFRNSSDGKEIVDRLSLARYGIIPSNSISTLLEMIWIRDNGAIDLYEKQIKLELLLLWEETLHQNGFPYQLMAYQSDIINWEQIKYEDCVLARDVGEYKKYLYFFFDYPELRDLVFPAGKSGMHTII